ncbi:MAG: hypothetical protein LBH39_03965 [Clostridiales Family XIII bacterium]|jgi:hypothetical protein|nr:hypothetical protein [Clostridiales Family XIII bacterium]
MMDENRFASQLFLIVPQVIRLIVEKRQIDEGEAAELFYVSELYARLEDEQTKLWHLSPPALFEMFCEEQETGKITYPEEA